MLLEYFKLNWDYELIDSGEGYRLERWGNIFLSRPDPQIIWPKSLPDSEWEKAAAKFIAGKGEDKGKWDIKNKIPNPWTVTYKNTKFLLKLSPFKHTGLFAEQAGQWEWMLEKLKVQNEKIKILNLFAYTGGATMVLAKAGCQVTHVDASNQA
jgi:23S rRNA (cytosine1962-C5)-methyltransferase